MFLLIPYVTILTCPCVYVLAINYLFDLIKMDIIVHLAIFYLLNIFYVSKPRYFYIFGKVCSNVNFEKWNHLKIIYG